MGCRRGSPRRRGRVLRVVVSLKAPQVVASCLYGTQTKMTEDSGNRLREINEHLPLAKGGERERLHNEALGLLASRKNPNQPDASPRSNSSLFQDLPTVDIDSDGCFKYVLLEGECGGQTRTFVRGTAEVDYHFEVIAPLELQLEEAGIRNVVLGGGRIRRLGRRVEIFGFSYTYGRADHEKTAMLIRGEEPHCQVVVTDEEY
eukprot:Polyplicarium_translucidae@DN3129_c0_g1_i1.p2